MSYSPYTGAFAAPTTPTTPVEPRRRTRSTIGTGALLLALLALSLAWVPVVGLVMLIPAALAVLLGVVGFTKASVDGKTRRGMPFVATVLGMFTMFLAPAATMVGALIALPMVMTVVADQVQVELEHDLTRGGMPSDDATRIGEEVGDALRTFAKPRNWRDGISAAHRFGLLMEDYERDNRFLDDDDTFAKATLLANLKNDVASLAERYDVELSTKDLDAIITALEKRHTQERAAERERRSRRDVRITIGGDQDGGCHDFR